MRADNPAQEALFLPGGSHGCLLLDGFADAPAHMRRIGEALNARGYTVSAPLLYTRGATLRAARASNWRRWLDEARMAYMDLTKKCAGISVIGLSMGGVLALILAEKYPVNTLVCLSPAIAPRIALGWAAPAVALVAPRMAWPGADQACADGPANASISGREGRGMAASCVRDMLKLIHLAEQSLFAVVAPTLVIQPLNDRVVRPNGAVRILRDISARDKTVMWLKRSGHLCTEDCERELVFDTILKCLSRTDATKSLAL